MSLEIDPKTAAERLRAGSLLVDVREDDEWREAHVAQAHWIPLGQLKERLSELPPDAEIICMCRSGRRSEKARQIIKEQRPQARVVNMTGGILQWVKDGLPVVSGG